VPRVRVHGVNIHYQQAGRGPDVVLIHGLAANHAFWYLAVVPGLAKEFRVTVYDLRGHGYSDMPRSCYTSADMAEDLCLLLNELGIGKAHLVGHSFGAAVGLQLASRRPDRVASITVADGRVHALQPRQRLRDWPFWLMWKDELERAGIAANGDQEVDYELLESVARKQLQAPVPIRNEVRSVFIPFHSWNGGRRSARQWLQLLDTTSARNDFGCSKGLTVAGIRNLSHPVLAIYGEYSFCLPTCRRLQRIVPNCRTVILPRVGHFYPFLQPALFLREVHEFLSEQDRRQLPSQEVVKRCLIHRD